MPATCLAELRKALDDEVRTSRFIETAAEGLSGAPQSGVATV
jgi:hypothetical protein